MNTPDNILTLINIFPVTPEQQENLVEILTRASEETMKHLDGFVGASVYRGLDGTYVANYVQWRNREDFKRMLERPEAQQHFAEVHKVTKGNPQLYELASVIQGKHKNVAMHGDEHRSVAGRQVLDAEFAERKQDVV